MSDADFVTVFNVADSGYRNWWFPAFGLIFVIIGLFLPKLFDAGVFPNYQKRMFGGWFPAVWLIFSIFWTVTAFLFTFTGYWSAREELLSGKSNYVEGVVQDFVPYVPHSHDESFVVNGTDFHYNDNVVVAGFNHTAAYGGPIREGLYVRIWYSGGEILKLQVPK